jgi:hypothetical protein
MKKENGAKQEVMRAMENRFTIYQVVVCCFITTDIQRPVSIVIQKQNSPQPRRQQGIG